MLLQDARDELVFLRTGISQCYKMLISEPNTQGALFKAENILRDLMTSDTTCDPCEAIRRDLDTALAMLAGWCVAVDRNDASWDDWDDHYKDAMYRDGPLRAQLDKAIAEALEAYGV